METDLKQNNVLADGQVGLTQSQADADYDVNLSLLHIGHQVIARQKSETFLQGWRQHWRGALWSLAISMALWMEGMFASVTHSRKPS